MSGSTIGTLFRVTTFGESHGPAIGCIVDGCPPGLELAESDIQPELDRRRPGTSRHVTQRKEDDRVEILSGVFEGRTTGTPIGLVALGDMARGARPPLVQLGLDVGLRQHESGRAAVDDAADRRTVTLAEGRDAKQRADRAPGHGRQRPGSDDGRSSRPSTGQSRM